MSSAVATADTIMTDAELKAAEAAHEAKLAENRAQLDSEAEARRRRCEMRKARGAKLAAQRKAAKQRRAFKLAGVWAGAIAAAFGTMVWFAPAITAWVSGLQPV